MMTAGTPTYVQRGSGERIVYMTRFWSRQFFAFSNSENLGKVVIDFIGRDLYSYDHISPSILILFCRITRTEKTMPMRIKAARKDVLKKRVPVTAAISAIQK